MSRWKPKGKHCPICKRQSSICLECHEGLISTATLHGYSNLEKRMVESFKVGTPLYEARMGWVNRFKSPLGLPPTGPAANE